jgi:hypothetical protein
VRSKLISTLTMFLGGMPANFVGILLAPGDLCSLIMNNLMVFSAQVNHPQDPAAMVVLEFTASWHKVEGRGSASYHTLAR